MNSVQGLERAVELLSSTKMGERTLGRQRVREIFENPNNIAEFHERASKESSEGAGWIQLFKQLFETVLRERDTNTKTKGKSLSTKSATSATTAAENRLTQTVSLVRFVAERTVTFLPRKAFISLFSHMTAMLVAKGSINEAVAVDYAKALRSLLSFPPHLEHLKPKDWRLLMSVCWAGLLGDRVSLDDEEEWDEKDGAREDDDGDTKPHGLHDDDKATRKMLSLSVMNQILALIPLLLSSSRAHLWEAQPAVDSVQPPSLGYVILLKINRFIKQLPSQNSVPVDILHSLNIVLAELELNCRQEFETAALKLFPNIVSIWTGRIKGDSSVRESSLVSLRIMLPYVTNPIASTYENQSIRDETTKLVDWISKEREAGSRAIGPIDLKTIRFNAVGTGPFQIAGIMAGFGFGTPQALSWAAVELYADCCQLLLDSHTQSAKAEQRVKRQRTESSLSKLLSWVSPRCEGETRHLALQVIVFLVGKHWESIELDPRAEIRDKLLQLLDDNDAVVQSWSFIGLSCMATFSDKRANDSLLSIIPNTPSGLAARRRQEQPTWQKLWKQAVRKTSVEAVCRAASHAANVVLQTGKVDHVLCVRDIHSFLKNIDIQGLGPTGLSDASCAFLINCLETVRADAGLYSANLEDKVLDWFIRAFDRDRSEPLLSSATASNRLDLLCAICHFKGSGIADVTVLEQLPDSVIVSRILHEVELAPIRNVTLHASIPTLPVVKDKTHSPERPPSERTGDSLAELDARPRKLCDTLYSSLQRIRVEWAPTEDVNFEHIRKPIRTPERLRKAIDLVVLVLAFQATIQWNGFRVDSSGCLSPAAELLHLLITPLGGFSDSILDQRLVWRGFMPLYYRAVAYPEKWPILLKPDAASGIRRDILPPAKYYTHHADEEKPGNSAHDQLLAIIWQTAEVEEALQSLVTSTTKVIDNLINSGRGATDSDHDTDDGFGPIVTADADGMGQSTEAKEAERTTESLFKTLVDLRARGPMFMSGDFRSTKDTPVLNLWMSAEGSRFVQLGLVLCDALLEGSLRLNVPSVKALLREILDQLNSYRFQRDGSFIRFAIMFLSRSIGIWLSPDSGLTDTAMDLAMGLLNSNLPSWSARLQMLMFIDEYLDYDPSYELWIEYSDTNRSDAIMGGIDPVTFGPLTYVLASISDLDSRVRFRAMSSAAAVHYLQDLSMQHKGDAYMDVVQEQGNFAYSWDHYLTNLFWKLNSCLASANLRSATIFHLYEVVNYSQTFLPFLQAGLEAVAGRLGLDSLKMLFAAHSTLVVLSQLRCSQLPLNLPSTLYGCASRKEFAQLCIETVGARLLSDPIPANMAFFSDACAAAKIRENEARERHLPFAAAIAVTEGIATLHDCSTSAVTAICTEALAVLPPPSDDMSVKKFLQQRIEFVITNLLGLTDLASSNEELAQMIDSFGGGAVPKNAGNTFLQLMANDPDRDIGNSTLEPFAADSVVIQAHGFFSEVYGQHISKVPMVFNGIFRLFFAVNAAYLVNEQRRYLRAIAMLATIYAPEFTNGMILQHFLSNVVALLPVGDLGGVAMSMLEWGFERVACMKTPPDLVDIMINLGSARTKLQALPHLNLVLERLDEWVVSKAQSWSRSSAMESALDKALVFWPSDWTANFPSGLEFDFTTVANIAERPTIQDPMALSRRLNKTIDPADPTQRETFLLSTFWYLKKALTTSQWDSEGAMAFLDLVYKTCGDIRAPSDTAIGGLTGSTALAEQSAKFNKEPEIITRVIVMLKLLQQTQTDDFRLRTITFEVLQSMFLILKDMVDKSTPLIPSELRELVVYLVPSTSTSPALTGSLDALDGDASNNGWVHKSRNLRTWAKDLAALLGTVAAQDDPFYACLHPLLSSEAQAAIDLLPLLVQAVLTCGALNHEDETAKRAKTLTNHFSAVLQFPGAATETLETIINIVLHLRHFSPPYDTGELGHNHWLRIDSIVLSEAAGKCGAYASSLLFLEMAKDRDDTDGDADLDLSSSRVQKIMYDIYSNVEDPDGFYGIQNNDVMDSLLRRLDHEGQPVKSLGYNMARYETTPYGTSQSSVSSLQNLHDLGFHSFAGTFMQKTREPGETADALSLELAWRMGDWDVPVTQDVANTPPGRFYNALRAVHRERDFEVARGFVDDTIRQEMIRFQEIGVERMTEVKEATINLLCLNDIAKWISVPMQSAIGDGDFGGRPLSNFGDLSASFDFVNAERLSATRLSLIRAGRARENKNLIGKIGSNVSEGLMNLEIGCQLRLSDLARKEGNLQAAVNAVTAVRQIEQVASSAAQDEVSQVLWAQGHHSLAIQQIDGIIKHLDEKVEGRRKARLLGRSAHWTALAKLKAAEAIHKEFRSAMKVAGEVSSPHHEQAQIAYEFAMWADSCHATLSKSPELERLKTKKDVFDQLDASLKSMPPGTPRGQASIELEEDHRQMKIKEKDLETYLTHALKGYSTALALCDDYDDCITRLCSLWLAHNTDGEANTSFSEDIKTISAHKFIMLAPQLAARLYTSSKTLKTFNMTLNKLMLRLAAQHPYHVMYQIITLAAAAKASSSDTPKSSRSRPLSSPASSSQTNGRTAAAMEIMQRLKANTEYPVAAKASRSMEKFAHAAAAWAQMWHDRKDELQKSTSSRQYVPPDCPLSLRFREPEVPIATVIPAIDLTLQYANVIMLQGYSSKFKVAGGIHRPAIMTARDWSAREYVQLFKAEDEVRQDAVMEQVFDLTNRLLRRDRKANARNLAFRTYTVIPLQNKTGIIEFVGNTMAIGAWFLDAHARYRQPIDLGVEVVRKQLSSIQNRSPTSESLVVTYKHVMERFKPVMRHFFTERRRDPLAWFSMRLAYARSVAVTSIVGWMVGLGDRHCSNILIDTVTGELVHIDFGIVFEEGKKLRIPEKVPFRLTNDIVDGLGITGVEGTFKQCTQHTLRVLRDSSDRVLTILEVFKHDPLYAWTGDRTKLLRAQPGGFRDSEAQAGQDKAERVLSAIRNKLGHETSVEYQVNNLIQEARNPDYLAKIYVGWQPWY